MWNPGVSVLESPWLVLSKLPLSWQQQSERWMGRWRLLLQGWSEKPQFCVKRACAPGGGWQSRSWWCRAESREAAEWSAGLLPVSFSEGRDGEEPWKKRLLVSQPGFSWAPRRGCQARQAQRVEPPARRGGAHEGAGSGHVRGERFWRSARTAEWGLLYSHTRFWTVPPVLLDGLIYFSMGTFGFS